MNVLKRAAIFYTILAAVLITALCISVFANNCLFGTVLAEGGKVILVQVADDQSFRFLERLNRVHTPDRVKLIMNDARDFRVGDHIFAITGGGQEDSNPPRIRALFALPLK